MKYLEFAENVRALGKYKVEFGKDKVVISEEVKVEAEVFDTVNLKTKKTKKIETPKKRVKTVAEVSMKDQYKYSCDASKYPEIHELCYKLAITDITKRGSVSVAE